MRSREDSSGGSSAKTAAMSSAALAMVWKVPCARAPADSVPSASLPPAQPKHSHHSGLKLYGYLHLLCSALKLRYGMHGDAVPLTGILGLEQALLGASEAA